MKGSSSKGRRAVDKGFPLESSFLFFVAAAPLGRFSNGT